jgi:hypothetical protein
MYSLKILLKLPGQGYKQLKAKLGMRRVRPWRWVPFTNPARSDGAVFHHWKRTTDEAKDYPFAKFNKVCVKLNKSATYLNYSMETDTVILNLLTANSSSHLHRLRVPAAFA